MTRYICPGCDLTGKSFAGVDLTNADLRGAKLDSASFTGATELAGCDVTGASMLGTDFSRCDVSGMLFAPSPKFGVDTRGRRTTFAAATVPYAVLGNDWSNVDLTEAVVTQWPSDLSALTATNAILARMVFGARNFTNVHFSGCDLSGADFSGATLNFAVFNDQCNLTGATFRGATMRSAVLDTSTLTRTDFTGVTSLANASLLQTRMDGTRFDGSDVTHCAFSQPPRFSSDPALITSFRGATLNLSLIGLQWSCLDLTGAVIVGLTPAVDLTWLAARSAVLGAMSFRGYALSNADFTGARFAGTDFTGATLVSAIFDEAVATPRSSPRAPSVVFDNATLTNASFHAARLPGASFIQASLHGATMTSMDLTGVNLTGAQLGSQGLLFTVADPAAYASFLAALQSENVSVIVAVFQAHAVGITHATVAPPSRVPPITVWVVTDTDRQNRYTVRNLTMSGQRFISVFSNDAPHADLGDTYMPAAVLTQVNMYGVFASGVHLYGSGTRLDNAILEAVDFSKGNLGTADFSQATLNDAIFDDAILTGAVFQGASLVPGQSGRGVSFQRANLQGTDFTTAKLYGANLQNAAMCLAASPRSNGVWLASLAPGDPLYPACLNELRQAVNLFSMDPMYESQLSRGTIDAAFRSAFAAASGGKYALSGAATCAATEYDAAWQVGDGAATYQVIPGIDSTGTAALEVMPTAPAQPFYIPLADRRDLVAGTVTPRIRSDFRTNGGVSLSGNAQVTAVMRAVVWQISDGPVAFALWDGFDETTARVLFVRPAVPHVAALFAGIGVAVPRLTVTARASGWSADNDSSDPFSSALGYVQFNMVQGSPAAPLDVYGAVMRVQRLSAPDQLQYYTIVCEATVIAPDNFDAQTVWPDGTKQAKVSEGVILPVWLRARTAPQPPDCVPTPYSYCPAPADSAKGRTGARRGRIAATPTNGP